MYINVLNLVAGAVCIQDIVRESTFIIILYIIYSITCPQRLLSELPFLLNSLVGLCQTKHSVIRKCWLEHS